MSALFETGKARELSASAIAVYCYLAYRQGSHASTWPSVRRIGEDVGMHMETVCNALEELQTVGLLQRAAMGQRGAVSLYQYRLTDIGTHVPPNAREIRTSESMGADTATSTPTPGTVVPPERSEIPNVRRSEIPNVADPDVAQVLGTTLGNSERATLGNSERHEGAGDERSEIPRRTLGNSEPGPAPSPPIPSSPPSEPDQEPDKTDPPSGGPPHPQGEDLSRVSKPKKKRQAQRYAYTQEFEEFWRAYPRRVEKREAFECWKVRLKETMDDGTPITPGILIEAARQYAQDCRRKGTTEQYMKHPSTFLGPKHPFADYVKPKTTPSGSVWRPAFLQHPEAFPEYFGGGSDEETHRGAVPGELGGGL